MKTVYIKFDSIDSVKEFVRIINSFEGDFVVVSDSYTINAKSIIGLFSLDLSQPVQLNIHSLDDNVINALNNFLVG